MSNPPAIRSPQEKNYLLRHGWKLKQIQTLEQTGNLTPVEYLVGQAEFMGLSLSVTPAVLIPRLETEHLVKLLLAAPPSSLIIEVGTGSLAIAAALAHHLPSPPPIIATDISLDALAVAATNLRQLHLKSTITLLKSDLLSALDPTLLHSPWSLIANLPYIPTPNYLHLHPSVKNFEPRLALDGGPTGLTLIKKLLTQIQALPQLPQQIFLEIDPSHSSFFLSLTSPFSWQIHLDFNHLPRFALAYLSSTPTSSPNKNS
jgi:release factor glutamine methyltransferase